MCAHAVRVALKDIPGVQTVNVSLEKGEAVATFAPGNTVRYEQLLRAIEKNGFVVKGSKLVVDGQIVPNGNAPEFKVTGSGDQFRLQPSANVSPANQMSGTVEIIGSVGEAPKGKAPEVMQYESVTKK